MAAGLLFAASTGNAAEGLSFNHDVRPILSENCFACHGFDSKKREAGLRLDTPEGAYATRDGLTAIRPGDLAGSEAWRRILSTDPDEVMPPPKSHKKLSPSQKEVIRRWIEQGAPYQRHWAFEPPMGGASEAGTGFIDRRLADRMAADGLAFAPEAGRETLVRRVSLTLTGLPPSLAEINQCLGDSSPEAYEAMVDRYLASPRFGEEMARHWLDVARYADTHGLHLDNERSMWPYRDWVVRTFNQNLPFDQFTVWQIAGDQLPSPTPDQILATGFSRCNVTTSEGGAIDEEYRHLYAVDRTATLTTAWLGLTGGCAQCHDHKYDPLTTAEFYSLYAFFFSAADPPMDKNIRSTEPFLRLPGPGQQAALDRATLAERQAAAALDGAAAASAGVEPSGAVLVTEALFDDEFVSGAEIRNTTRNPSVWLNKPAFGAKSGQRVLQLSSGQFAQEIITPGLIPLVLGESPAVTFWLRLDPENPPRAVSLELNSRRAVWGDAAGYDATQYAKDNQVVLGPLPKPGEWIQLRLDPAAAFGLKAGARIQTVSVQQLGGTACFDRLEVSSLCMAGSHPRLSFTAWWELVSAGKKGVPEIPAELSKTLLTPPAQVADPKAREALRRFHLARIACTTDTELTAHRAAWEAARAARSAAELAIEGSFIFRDADKPRETFVAVRGAYNKPGERVEPSTPAVFHPLKKADPDGRATRLDLARWLVATDNPLTARVTVNRFWQQVFGTGLVRSSHDFGAQGEPPSHPELLDELAVRFQKNGWNVKQLLRELVASRAFRQAAHAGSDRLQRDPANRLLARGPRIRLDAEQIRDQALFVSGLLRPEMGGPGVRTYQPPNIWEPVGYGDSNTRYYLQDHGPALYRRSLYCFLKRTAPPPFMSNFDAPNREQSCTRRERSNTPLQALQLLNDVQHFEAARVLAGRVLREGGSEDKARIDWLMRTVVGRRPDPVEAGVLGAALARQRELYHADPAAAEKVVRVGESQPTPGAPAPETAAWALLANLVLNLDEALNRN